MCQLAVLDHQICLDFLCRMCVKGDVSLNNRECFEKYIFLEEVVNVQ